MSARCQGDGAVWPVDWGNIMVRDRIVGISLFSAMLAMATPAYAGAPVPAPAAGIGIGAVVLIGLGYRALRGRIGG